MKKGMLIIVGLGCIGSSLMAGRPRFEQNYITMSANRGKCGIVTLMAKKGFMVRVRSQKFRQHIVGKGITAGRLKSKNWMMLPPKGLPAKYDWAGERPLSHYRIFCQFKKVGASNGSPWMPAKCSRVLRLRNIKHDLPCGGRRGIKESFRPLNMETFDHKVSKTGLTLPPAL